MSVLKEFGKNKYTVTVFIIFLGLFLIGWVLFGLIMPHGDQNEKYGNRLDDIKEANAMIKDSDTSKIVDAVKKKSFVKEASTNVEGRIVNVIVEVKKGTSVKDAKSLGNVTLDALSDQHKKLYDVQLLVKNEDSKDTNFPIIGYKNSSDKGFAF